MKGITHAYYNKPKQNTANSTKRLGRMPTKPRASQLKESATQNEKEKEQKREGRDVKNRAFPQQPMRRRGVALRHTRAITGEEDEKKK